MVCEFAMWGSGQNAGHRSHSAPVLQCTCGIYARKDREGLRKAMHRTSLVYGEVSLWGSMVEHQYGWRAQYAYPKSFFLSHEVLPVSLVEIGARIETLSCYHCDIFILHDGVTKLPLWKHDSGFDDVGLDYLTKRASRWYTQRNQGIVRGDRFAVRGRGIAVVEEIRASGPMGCWEKRM